MLTLAPRPGSVLTLFHVSPASRDSIYATGILPERALGALKAVWLVDKHELLWAIAHTAARHNVTIVTLFVYECHVPEKIARRTRWPGVYYVKQPVMPVSHTQAIEFLDYVESEVERGLPEK